MPLLRFLGFVLDLLFYPLRALHRARGKVVPEGTFITLTILSSASFGQGVAASLNRSLKVGGGTIAVSISGRGPVGEAALFHWIDTAASAVTAYFGRYPVPRVRLYVNVSGNNGRILTAHWPSCATASSIPAGTRARSPKDSSPLPCPPVAEKPFPRWPSRSPKPKPMDFAA